MFSTNTAYLLNAITTLVLIVTVKDAIELLWLGVCVGISFLGMSLQVPFGVQGVSAERVCQHNIQYSVANCSHRHLDRVPWGLHHNLDTLDLTFNRFTVLQSMAFKSYASLQVLRLTNNAITTLQPDSLAKLDQLHTLELANNMLSTVPSQVFKTLPGLLHLNLSGNNLVLVPNQAFLGLRLLEVLDLSANKITELQPHALFGLQRLQILGLEDNALRWLTPTVFQGFSRNLQQLHLFKNPWLCDCKIRHMHQWLTNVTASIWEQPGETIRCDSPSLNKGKSLLTIPLDELACRVEMRTSGSTQIVERGQKVMMECIYFSIPDARPIWQKNQMPINFSARPNKYIMTIEDSPVTTTRLYVRDFQYSDIMEYECLAQNVRGSDSTIFKVTLKGIPFESVTNAPPTGSSSPMGINSKMVVVIVGVVCGIILLIALSLLIFFCRSHAARRQQERRDAVVESVKKQFLENEDSVDTSKTQMNRSKSKQFDDKSYESNVLNDGKTSTCTRKAAENEDCRIEREPMHAFNQPSSPFSNGNTYVSFSREVMEPELFPLYPKPYGGKHEELQTDSQTPLLDRCRVSASDVDDSFDDTIQCHAYESITLFHPRHSQYSMSSLIQSTRSISPNAVCSHPDYQDYRETGYKGHTRISQKDTHMKRKSKSVGNLGLSPFSKSPGSSDSNECVEMSSRNISGGQ